MFACLIAGLAGSQTPSTDPPQDEENTAEGPINDPCQSPEIALGHSWIDRVHRGVYRAVCASALWFDNLFGDPTAHENTAGTYGRLLVGAAWDEQDGLNADFRMRARADFPNLERRLNAFIGKVDRQDLVSDRLQENAALPNILSLPDDDEWLVGLGYSPSRSLGNDFGVDLGADLDFPVNPFLRLRYKQKYPFGESRLLGLRHSLFWEREKGYGTTQRIDLDQLLGDQALLRWRNIGTFSEASHGIDWYSEVSLYHRFGRARALALQLSADGETDAPVRVEDYVARVIYRQRVLRDWLFLDVRPAVAFRCRHPQEDREKVPIVTVGFELVFGGEDR